MTSKDIEVALCAYPSSLFYCRRWVVVPRVSWGLESHECDVLALSSSNYAHEIEIKISVSDLKADFKKHHQHISRDNKIKCLWYAAPIEMQAAMEQFVPEHAGIIVVYQANRLRTKIIRRAKQNMSARKFTIEERMQLLRLGAMRYWTIVKKDVAAEYGVKVEGGKDEVLDR